MEFVFFNEVRVTAKTQYVCVSCFQWRRFNFFDKELVKNVSSDQPFDLLKVSNIE